MNSMDTMPGFSAEAALGRAEGRYVAMTATASSSVTVVPQIPIGLCTKAAYYCNRGYQKWCDIFDKNCESD